MSRGILMGRYHQQVVFECITTFQSVKYWRTDSRESIIAVVI